ncbi:unnamed protein product, partial [marine sediment metagenome]
MSLRQLGVFGDKLPTKKTKVVRPADFSIGCIVGLFERRYEIPMVVNNITELQEKFGAQETSTYYGWDAAIGFFNNAVGVAAKLYVVSHVGYTGAAIDGVVATASINDGTNPSLKMDSAYEEEPDYSTWGNRTGYTIEQGNRFATA